MFLFPFLYTTTYSQENATKKMYVKISGGSVSFGTGDYIGYSLSFDVSKNILNREYKTVNKLLLGGELLFESGTINPTIINPTLDNFMNNHFYHTSSSILWPKLSYYPFGKIVKGFNIQVGPTVSYSQRSYERMGIFDVNNEIRMSILEFDNGFSVGYRISTGIEFEFGQKFLTGFRLDFSNNTEGEINTLAGVKAGIIF